MRRLSQNAEWLFIVPEPTSEERDRARPKTFLLVGVFQMVVALGSLAFYYVDPEGEGVSYELLFQSLFVLALGFVFIVQAALYAPSARWHRVVPAPQMIHTLALLALAVSLNLLILAGLYDAAGPNLFEQILAVFAVALWPFVLYWNYSQNRRRACRSQSA